MEEKRGLLEVMREKMRIRHMAYRTEQAYLRWIRQYVVFHQRRHPRKLGVFEVEQFLIHLAVERKVSAGTQNQALQALLFLYPHVLGVELPWLEGAPKCDRTRLLSLLQRPSHRAAVDPFAMSGQPYRSERIPRPTAAVPDRSAFRNPA